MLLLRASLLASLSCFALATHLPLPGAPSAKSALPHLDFRTTLLAKHSQGLRAILEFLLAVPRQSEWSPGKLRPCSFTTEVKNYEAGVCTYYGACRFQGHDYMFQVCYITCYILYDRFLQKVSATLRYYINISTTDNFTLKYQVYQHYILHFINMHVSGVWYTLIYPDYNSAISLFTWLCL